MLYFPHKSALTMLHSTIMTLKNKVHFSSNHSPDLVCFLFCFVIQANCEILLENKMTVATIGHLNTSAVSLCHEGLQKHTLSFTEKKYCKSNSWREL